MNQNVEEMAPQVVEQEGAGKAELGTSVRTLKRDVKRLSAELEASKLETENARGISKYWAHEVERYQRLTAVMLDFVFNKMVNEPKQQDA